MRLLPFLAIASAAAGLAVPVAAADPAPKTKKVCKAINNGNPLFPTMRCHTVEIETAATPAAAAPAASPAAPAASGTEVAANGTRPQ